MSTEPREKRSSFADLAKLAQMTPPPSASVAPVTKSEREENSGVIDLAALQAGEEQAQAAAAAADALASRATMASGSAHPSYPSARESFGPSAASGTTRALSWLALAGIAAAAAAAAGAIVAKRVTHPAADTVVAAASPAASSQASGAPGARAFAQSGPQSQTGGDRAVDPSNLPRAGKPGQLVHASAPSKGAIAHSPAAVAANDKAGPAEAANDKPETAAAGNAGAGGKSLQTLIQESVGSPKEEPPPAVLPTTAQGDGPESNGSVPLRPSLGAINGALGTVMPAARACVDEDAPVSRASVSFNSDGTVGGVSVSGWAAGKPAEACIRAALGKARVPPFAQPTFTAPATIRSN
jgi:hypothetical protein